MIGADRHADGSADIDAMSVKLERLGNGEGDPSRNPLDVADRSDLREEECEFVAGKAREQRPLAGAFGDFRSDHDPEPVRHHDQQLVAACVAEAVIDHLEAVEVDEQHRAAAPHRRPAQKLVGFGTEMKAVGQRRDRVVHAERLRILDRCANLREQRVHGRCKLGHVLPNDRGRRRDKVAVLNCEKPVSERGQRASAFAVGPFRGDVADEQAEGAGDDRCDDLIVQIRDVEEGAQREDERGNPRRAREQGVAEFLGSACFHRIA